jgi:MerR family copper efflux transcriptional regulator
MKIGEVSTASGVSQRMIRHYEKIGLIPAAPRRDSGYRDYDQRDLHTLNFIGRARDLGFPIEDIRRLLALWSDRGRSSSDVKQVALARAAELRERMAVLEGMCRTLEHLAEACHGNDRPECPILDKLEDRGP